MPIEQKSWLIMCIITHIRSRCTQHRAATAPIFSSTLVKPVTPARSSLPYFLISSNRLCSSCRSAKKDQKDPDAKGQPVSRVHVDYTVKSGPERLQAVLPNEAEKLMKTPFAVIQVSML